MFDYEPRPRLLISPQHSRSIAPEAIEFCGNLDGVPLDPHQELMARQTYALEGGTWAASQTTTVEPRQNGKTAAHEKFALFDAVVLGIPTHTWTAHRGDTLDESFERICTLADSTRAIRRRIKKISHVNGKLKITFKSSQGNLARIIFRNRSKTAGRGFGSNIITIDEALSILAVSVAALKPTGSAQRNRQIRHLSSAAGPDAEGDYLRALRDAAIAGAAPRSAYVEFAAERRDCGQVNCSHLRGTPGCAYDDVELLIQANYAIACGRMTLDAVADERDMPPALYAMERLGWWIDPPKAANDIRIEPEAVAVLSTNDESLLAVDGDPAWVAVDTSWDRSKTWIAVATKDVDGLVRVQIAICADGSDWVVDALDVERLNFKFQTIDVQRGSPAQPVFETLNGKASKHRKTTRARSMIDVAAACSRFADLVRDGRVRVGADDAITLALQAQASVAVGRDMWAWDRKRPWETSQVDLSPLVAVTLAASNQLFRRGRG
jgi:hypothetical protein